MYEFLHNIAKVLYTTQRNFARTAKIQVQDAQQRDYWIRVQKVSRKHDICERSRVSSKRVQWRCTTYAKDSVYTTRYALCKLGPVHGSGYSSGIHHVDCAMLRKITRPPEYCQLRIKSPARLTSPTLRRQIIRVTFGGKSSSSPPSHSSGHWRFNASCSAIGRAPRAVGMRKSMTGGGVG